MSSVTKYSLSEAKHHLKKDYSLICFASFEDRCLTIPKAVQKCKIHDVIVLLNVGESAIVKNKENADCIKSLYENASIIEIDMDDSLYTAEILRNVVKDISRNGTNHLLVDISTFTHETLLILLRIISECKHIKTTTFLYNGAVEYSTGDSKEQVWLSKGCKDVRNVIGFPGLIRPSCKTHVVVLSGFEIERLTGLVEMLEPDKLSIGEGEDPTHGNHEEHMNYFIRKIDNWKKMFSSDSVNMFKFSCSDIEKTIEQLNRIVEDNKDNNIIIIPLNTKLSTLATGVVALNNNRIQICYSIPEMYNTDKYSKPSNNITIVDLDVFSGSHSDIET